MTTSTSATAIQKRRRLQELFARKKEVRFNAQGINNGDPADDDVVIAIVPPNPAQRDEAVRDAQASRARALLMLRDESSTEYITARQFVEDMPDNELIEYVLAIDEPKRRQEAQRRVLSFEEWKDFDELRDAMRQWEEAGFPHGPEWEPLMKRDRSFGDQVTEEMGNLAEIDREALLTQGRERMVQKAMERRIEVMGTAAFMKTFEDEMLFFACRDPENTQVLFFESAAELRTYPEFISVELHETLNSFITEVDEAKN